MSKVSDFKKYYSQQPYNIKRVLKEFNKPIHENIFFCNIEMLRLNSKLILFNSLKWKMRPDMFCQMHYNEHQLYPVILLVNNISTLFKFVADNLEDRVIIAPYETTITKVLNS